MSPSRRWYPPSTVKRTGDGVPGLPPVFNALHCHPVLSFLTREEVQAILAATDDSWTGQRDHLLFLLLYNTGARVSKLLALRTSDALPGNHLLLHGKGRKERQVPLWRGTQQRLRRWIRDNRQAADAPFLPNRFGQLLSRSGVAWQLQRCVRQASRTGPSLKGQRISPHTFRHTTAMHLLQSGVAPEVIALWLGHESTNTTHLYIEADLEMKRQTLELVSAPKIKRPRRRGKDPRDLVARRREFSWNREFSRRMAPCVATM